MKPIVINSPSLANSNVLHLHDDIEALKKGNAQFLHVDIMDGHYVPNICFPLRMIKDIKTEYPDMILDVHLMVTEPIDYIAQIAEAGAEYYSFHIDSTTFVIRTLERIKASGMKAGVVINPSQRMDLLEPYLDLVDMVTVMAVEPGFSGQTFMPRTINRVAELASLRKKSGNDFLINIDGAINYPSLEPVIRRGANVLVTGIYTVFNQPDGLESACHRFDKYCDDILKMDFIGDAY